MIALYKKQGSVVGLVHRGQPCHFCYDTLILR